jgi:D-alanine-D-alanine ligase
VKKLRVGVVFGGRSGEHEVSLRSAEFILSALDRDKYEVVPIAITKEGKWLTASEPRELEAPEKEIQRALEAGSALELTAEPSAEGLLDVVFPIVHGTFGEDGTIQGFLELADVAYVGAGVLGSAVAMDKDVMKRLLRDAGLPVVDYWRVLASELDGFVHTFEDSLPYPVFVKPANLGSSVGISKVKSGDELRVALVTAFEYDRKAVVERGVDAREIELSVLGNDDPIVSVPGEVRPVREFYDYQAKYVSDDSELIIPATLEAQQVREAQSMALAAFKALECSGMARVDLFLEKETGKFYVNEINTLPGFTSISQYPRLWEASGMTNVQLVDRLLQLAVERHEDRAQRSTSYDPD